MNEESIKEPKPEVPKIPREIDVAYTDNPIPDHIHNGFDISRINYVDLWNRTRFILYRILAPLTSCAVATKVGGDLVMPFGGHIDHVGATVDTAGTTGTMTIDVNKNGTTIMPTTKVSVSSGSKTSRPANPVITVGSGSFLIGDIFTFDIDAVHTTPALGLTIFMRVVETTL